MQRTAGTSGASAHQAVIAGSLLALLILGFVARHVSRTRAKGSSQPMVRADAGSAQAGKLDWGDRFGDGTPDFLRLFDPADQAAFRRWFTLIAEAQSLQAASAPPEIKDCASLLRYCYREALRRHDDQWFLATGMQISGPPGEIRAWHYPDTPLGLGLFRVRPGPFQPADISDDVFAQFADAKTLVQHNTFLVGRDVQATLPGDLLFFRQFGHASPWHSMIVTRVGRDAQVVYHTGPDHGRPGELRRVTLADLLDHPEPQWRPVPSNPNFLGVYRWNILRGTS